MSLETPKYCPECDEEQDFWLNARTSIELGEKSKWECTECGHQVVEIEDQISSVSQA
ncbi:phage terminase large subunit family protein [Salinarchaeum sp. IM2453]|uniref:phage terminase large subunit family protein n=1 Tax=Salinarchaeum sp. IM2453 TaxID=2862870 RepID=UPI001C82B177|nr:phage terminase large subunit family protein [Salinarchaeum sp. IM2453]QZA89271.1 phage terminase large subunit family protein [Salinarchaeum sp. IM2453]